MVASASFGTLHAAVTGKEITAHAQGKAVCLVMAQKLLFSDLHDGDYTALSFVVVVKGALDVVQVCDSWMVVLSPLK